MEWFVTRIGQIMHAQFGIILALSQLVIFGYAFLLPLPSSLMRHLGRRKELLHHLPPPIRSGSSGRSGRSTIVVLSSLHDWLLDQGCKNTEMNVIFLTLPSSSSSHSSNNNNNNSDEDNVVVDDDDDDDDNNNSQNDMTITAMSKKAINKGEVLLTIPLGLCLDQSKAFNQWEHLFPSSLLKTSEMGQLALLLLSEKKLNKQSKYYPYLLTLPRQCPGTFSWSIEEISIWKQSTTRDIQTIFSFIQDDIEFIKLKMSGQEDRRYYTQEFLWALGIIKAYGLRLDSTGKGSRSWILIPGINTFQYDLWANNEPVLAASGLFGAKAIKLMSDRSYKANEPVVMSLGVKSPAEFLEDHGYLPTLSTNEATCEMVVQIEDNDKFADDKRFVLEENGQPKRMTFDLVADPSIGLDSDLLHFLRLKLISGKDAFILEPCFSNIVYSVLARPFSKTNEIAVLNWIYQYAMRSKEKILHCEQQEQQRGYDQQNDPHHHRRYLAKLREQELAALDATLETVSMDLQNIQSPSDNREYFQERRLREMDLLRPLGDDEIVY